MKLIYFFLFITISFTSCKNIPVKNNIIHSDTLLILCFDTIISKEILIPKYINQTELMPYFTLDTIIPVKNKQGKVTGKSSIKISANADGTLNFENEIINSDSIPQITNFVSIEVPTEKEKSFFEKIEDKILGFIDFIFIMLGLLAVVGFTYMSALIYKWHRNKKQWQNK